MTLRLPAGNREEMLAHAREGAPEEVVGVFGGARDVATGGGVGAEATAVVETVHRAANAADRPRTRYAIGAEEQFALMQTIEDAGRDVIGFYHSHPEGPLAPSPTDADRAAWPGRSYVIVSLAGEPALGSWRWSGEAFEREPLEVV